MSKLIFMLSILFCFPALAQTKCRSVHLDETPSAPLLPLPELALFIQEQQKDFPDAAILKVTAAIIDHFIQRGSSDANVPQVQLSNAIETATGLDRDVVHNYIRKFIMIGILVPRTEESNGRKVFGISTRTSDILTRIWGPQPPTGPINKDQS